MRSSRFGVMKVDVEKLIMSVLAVDLLPELVPESSAIAAEGFTAAVGHHSGTSMFRAPWAIAERLEEHAETELPDAVLAYPEGVINSSAL